MANHELAAALEHRGAIDFRNLQSRIPHQPIGSLRALLLRAGPFRAHPPHRDAFIFQNDENDGWAMSRADAQALRQRLDPAIAAAKLFAIDALRTALRTTTIGPGTLPDLVVSEVIRRVTDDVTNQILDAVVADAVPNFGRCGGMAYAAMDYFLAGRDVDDSPQQPSSGPLRDYIWQRLLDSLDRDMHRYLTWTTELHVLPVVSRIASAAIGAAAAAVLLGPLAAPIVAAIAAGEDVLGLGGAKALKSKTLAELHALSKQLDEWPCWPIGFIYGHKPLFWQQHQVLAIRLDRTGDGLFEMQLWDNNLGRDQTTLRIDTRGKEIVAIGDTENHANVKGILCSPYSPANPP
jgi:hypothetical protein